MASHWAYWVPLVVLGLGTLILWLIAKYQNKNGKINVLVKVFIFLKAFMEELERVTSDGDLTKEDIVACITAALLELRSLLGGIQETFEVGDTVKLEEAKEMIIEEGAPITWTETNKILIEKEATNSTLKKIKAKVSSINLKKK